MERIKLNNGRYASFPISENETFKFYSCETINEANELQMTLTDLGNKCSIGENSRGWFVRVEK